MRGNKVLSYIQSDFYRYTGTTSLLPNLLLYLRSPIARFHVVLRLRQGRGCLRYIGFILWALNRTKRLIILPPSTKIGYGLFISHYGSIIVNPTAVIGNNVNLSQGVVIGSNDGIAATIGDNTYIGPNVCIVENVHIGKNVTIGAGSVVTKDIPDNATAVGNYAKVINFRNPGRYIKNMWSV